MVAGQVKEIREPLFDTYSVAKDAALPTTIQFFASRTAAVNGPQITNMSRGGELPAPESMKVFSIRVEFVGCTEADILAILKAYCGRLRVSGVDLCTAPLEYFSAGAGIVTALATSTQTQNGVADPRATFQMPDGYEIGIDAGQPFSFDFISSTGVAAAGAAVMIRVYLDGLHSLPIG